jgi:hypothetical protein
MASPPIDVRARAWRWGLRVGEERMDAKRFVAGFVSTLVMLGSARAQEPPPPVSAIAPPPAMQSYAPQGSYVPQASQTPMTLAVPQATPGGYDVPGVSNWIRRDSSPCCNGPIGKHSEIAYELYFRGGPAIPLGDATLLSRNTVTGFTVAGGAQTLFYDHSFMSAWVIDTGIINSQNSGIHIPEPITLTAARPGAAVAPFTVTLRNLNRTSVNLGFGREWFSNPVKDQPAHWRFGIDTGARYGSMSVRLNEIVHRTDVIGGAYAGTHILYEFVRWNSIINVGVRSEFAYTWSDVFQRASDMAELNVLFNLGVRY